ncbi:uncharacterized protein LOC9650796 isoform X2 [Selaginella moellendorffii]|uniref:uncharacterized protein LOC9650796 isoform X2 n=1 Tax=Selaginella moellendorffii TaxID=88036 RepID=UPI000D1CB10D|nr:uncharacterized protein LOC9650796 isoform X2 [Selaginella moellendorffii]|eukprot:XP_024529756.1 uncharacterized protein LOC9650796 isoform X2 [Selaginella moellendorffii]
MAAAAAGAAVSAEPGPLCSQFSYISSTASAARSVLPLLAPRISIAPVQELECRPSSCLRCRVVPRAKSSVDSDEQLTVEVLGDEGHTFDPSSVSFSTERWEELDTNVLEIIDSSSTNTAAGITENTTVMNSTRPQQQEPPTRTSNVKNQWRPIFQGGVENLTTQVKEAVEKTRSQGHNWARNSKVAQVLHSDKKVISKWTMETALPVISEALFLTSSAGSSTGPAEKPVWQAPSYRGLSGWDIVAADIATIRQYFDNVKLQLAIWKLPLQEAYDPEDLAVYFNARPHLLLFRALEVSAAFSYLFVWYMFEKSITPLTKREPSSEEEKKKLMMKTAEMFKQTVLRLGPTFTKVAQSLSTRSDLIGPETAQVLGDLQDRLPPFPNEMALLLMEQELGRPISEVFSYISEEPVAAASLGQVYRGRTRDGQDVAVKVQRPNIFYSVARDVYILRLGLGLVRMVAGINSDLSVFADEVGKGLYGELDYRLEAQNASAFALALTPKLPFVVVPRVLRHLTTKKVMTMEWISGTRPVDLRRVAKGQDAGATPELRLEATDRLLEMVNKGVQSSLTQLLDVGILHADPHPGNIIYTPDNSIAYLDFGLICRMEKKHQYAMIAATAHLVNGDWSFLVDDLAEMDVVKPGTNRFRLRLALEDSLNGFVVKNGLPDFKFSQIIAKLFGVALKFRFRLPAYYTLILRSIASLEGMALAVDPNFKVFTKTYPFVVNRLLSDNSAPMRRILRTLLLTNKKEFRWNRVASLTSITSTEPAASNATTSLESTLCKLLLSSNGASLRRIILEADTKSLARAFVSKEAAPVRLKVAKLLADAFYLHGKKLLQEHASVEIDERSKLSSPIASTRQLQFLLRALVARLQKTPLLLLRAGWTTATVMGWALAAAFHRLAVGMSYTYLEPAPSTRAATA